MAKKTSLKILRNLKGYYLKTRPVNQILVRMKLATMEKRHDCSMQQHVDEVLGNVNDCNRYDTHSYIY